MRQKEKDGNSLVKELKENGSASGEEPKPHGWQELLEEMFSRVKELKDDVRASDQRIGQEAQEEQKEQKEAYVSGGRERVDDEQSAFVALLLGIRKNVRESHEKGEGRTTIS